MILSLQLEIVVNVVSLFLVSELMLGIDYLTLVPLSVTYVLGSTHNGYVYLSAARDHVIPVDEVDVREQTAVNHAVLNGHRFASAEEYGTQVTVSIHAGVVARLVDISAELRVDRTGMTVLMLLGKVGDHLSHNVEQVVLKELQIKAINIVRAFLNPWSPLQDAVLFMTSRWKMVP